MISTTVPPTIDSSDNKLAHGPLPSTADSSTAASPFGLWSTEIIDIENISLVTDRTLSERELCDLELLLNGSFKPVTGYLCKNDYYNCLYNMRLSTGEIWPMPIVMPVFINNSKDIIINNGSKDSQKSKTDGNNNNNNYYLQKQSDDSPIIIKKEKVVHLRDCMGTIIADLYVQEIYKPNVESECLKVFGTTDRNHPYVKYLYDSKYDSDDCYYLGGKVVAVNPIQHFDFQEFRKTPQEVKESIKKLCYDNVVGFQTRNPMHCSHYNLTLQALKEVKDNSQKNAKVHLLLTPTVGPTQPGDIEYYIRVRCYSKLIKWYHQQNQSVDIVLLPISMRMGGPREAVWHALIRRNYGCTHFIIGRDHAGPSSKRTDNGKSFYGDYDAHTLVQSVQDNLGIKPVFGKTMVYVGEENGGYIEEGDVVPDNVKPQSISGSEFRKRLQKREPVPTWFSFPEVVEELQKFYKPNHQTGLCIYFTGLPCSGKSTISKAVEAAIKSLPNETRAVTVLDADIIRTHLSKGLGFSKEDRSSNVRRIGYVASEIVKHGGICLVANIAPYQEDRNNNRNIIESTGGGYVEVYVSTPIEVCEGRDRKCLYKKARMGIISQFTGVSDPYEMPKNSEIMVNCSSDIAGNVEHVLQYLKASKWIL